MKKNTDTTPAEPALISRLKSLLVNKDFQTWHLIGWQHNRQPITEAMLENPCYYMEFNMDLT